MPESSFDSLVRLPPRRRRRHKGYTHVTRKNYRPPLSPIQDTDLYKMLAQPSVKTLETRLKECYHRLNKQKMALTTTVHHRSPRGSKRRPRRRSTRSKRLRRSTRSKRLRRSPRRSKRSNPVTRARARGRAAQRDREQKRVQQLLNRNW